VRSYQQQQLASNVAQAYKDLPFYCGLKESAAINCCFNHLIGLPIKNDKRCPLYDYELDLLPILDSKRYLWLKKARGLGITEFFLRYLCWLAVCKNERFKSKKFFLVSGPREDSAIELIKRIKLILAPLGILEETERTVAQVCEVNIQAFPSHHVNAMRGFTDVSFIFIDEADFFRLNQQQETRDVAEGYIAKTDPWIVMVSTPNLPGGLFEQMERNTDEDFIYHRVWMPYTVGVGKIYTQEEIDEAKRSPSFPREYDLKYGYGSGNVFRPEQIEACISRGGEEGVDENTIISMLKNRLSAPVSIGVDPGFGSSKFAICAVTMLDGQIHVIESQEYERADITYMADVCFELINKYEAGKIYIDAANPGLIKSLKISVGENPEYEKVFAQAKKDKVDPGERMRIVPVNFATDGRGLLMFMMSLVSSKLIRIRSEFAALIQQMRIARILPTTGKLDKYSGPTMDSLDACMLASWLWKFQ